MESERSYIPKPEKPSVLYHASSDLAVETFLPRSRKVRDPNEGPRIFATPSRAIASLFLVDSDDSWVQSGTRDGIPEIIISDEKRYRDLDKGGVVYQLPSDTFETDPDKGLGQNEWTSTEPVKPVDAEFVPSAIEDMLKNGVHVYFVDAEIWAAINQSPDHGESIINTLTPLGS